MNNSYEELKKKSEEKLEGHDDLRDLKRATFDHFLAKWENTTEENQGDDNVISDLKNAFPLGIRKFFPDEIEENKDSVKYKSKNRFSQKQPKHCVKMVYYVLCMQN